MLRVAVNPNVDAPVFPQVPWCPWALSSKAKARPYLKQSAARMTKGVSLGHGCKP